MLNLSGTSLCPSSWLWANLNEEIRQAKCDLCVFLFSVPKAGKITVLRMPGLAPHTGEPPGIQGKSPVPLVPSLPAMSVQRLF